MRIVCFLRSLGLGGIERQMSGLAVLLKEAGHDVVVMKYISEDFYRSYLEENGVRVEHIEKKWGSLGTSLAVARKLEEFSADIVISFAPSPGLKACYAKLMCRRKFRLVVSERNYLRRFHINDWYRFFVYHFLADRIVSNSYAQMQHIISSFPMLEGKTSCIVNFVDLEKHKPSHRHHQEGPVRLSVISRLCRRKNTHGLIKAAKELKDKGLSFHISWYGSTRETRYLRKCMKTIEKYGLKDVFEILEATRDVKSIYEETDVFCLPSFYEGTSNSMCEALASGLAVACSDVSDNALYVKHGKNGWLFNPHSVADMAGTLEEIISSRRETLQAYGRESRVIAEEKFPIERFNREYIGLIEDLSKAEL